VPPLAVSNPLSGVRSGAHHPAPPQTGPFRMWFSALLETHRREASHATPLGGVTWLLSTRPRFVPGPV